MDAILQRIEACYQLAEQHLEQRFSRPRVDFAVRGQKAGVAWLMENRLSFNHRLYQENREDFLHQTVPHEVAHLIAHALFGSRIAPHGREWRMLMQDLFGLPPLRCHNYRIERRVQTRYLYLCGCTEPVPFSPQRHALVKRGRRYQCLRCGSALTFSGKRRQAA